MSNSSLAENMSWLEQILKWLFQEPPGPNEARFRFFFQMLDKNPAWKTNFVRTLNTILGESQFLALFTHVGLAVEYGLWGDTVRRLVKKMIPAGGSTDFREMLLNVFDDEERIDRLSGLSDETLLRVRDLVAFPENAPIWRDIETEAFEALLFLSAHVAHYGTSSAVRNRLPRGEKISKSEFFKLGAALRGDDPALVDATLDGCELAVKSVYESLEASGVSVDAVNRLETISALVNQIRGILKLRTADSETEKLREVRAFLVGAAESGLRGRSVIGHIRRHFYLLSRKIVERNGQSGEHYIARNRAELGRLFKSAVGGGFIVVVMTIFKTWLIYSEPAPLFLATGIWIVYAFGFLTMQFFGYTLATKIPSFTASRLAGILKTVRKQSARDFRDEFRLVLKSQTIALLGNIAGVIPLALLVNHLIGALSPGASLMSDHYATHTIHDLNPLFSFAVPLGALTGVELWLSSVAGGWFENWVVFNRLPDAIEYHFRLRKFFGRERAKAWAERTLKHSSGAAANVTLGFLFGFVPLVGGLFGLNLNGNHVTISTAGAFFAVSTLHYRIPASQWVYTIAGLALIGLFNFVVSFGLAFLVAGNSQKMKLWRGFLYLKYSLGPRSDSYKT